MAERQVGLRIMLEGQHFLQIAPINESDARDLMQRIEGGQGKWENRVLVTGHSFTEDGQPWKYSIPTWRVVGMHTFSLEPRPVQGFQPNKPGAGGFGHSYDFSRS